MGGIDWGGGGIYVMDWRYGGDCEGDVDITRRSVGGL